MVLLRQPDANITLTATVRYAKPLRVGLLSNPQSGNNRRYFKNIGTLLTNHPEISHCETPNAAAVDGALQYLAEQNIELLIINGGDGTVQALLTTLLQHQPFQRLPLLAILPTGTTNMTAGDVGLQGNPHRALASVLTWAQNPQTPAHLVQRPVLCVQTHPQTAPLFGMFFGAGAIIRGIEFCHQRLYTMGLRQPWAPGLATLRVLAAMARRDPGYSAGVTISVGLGRQPPAPPQDFLLLLVSSLERLFLGLRPYWGHEPDALFYTAIRAKPKHGLRALPPLFWGRPHRLSTPENGYASHNIDTVRLFMSERFTLDGELYTPDSTSGCVTVSQGPWMSFIRP